MNEIGILVCVAVAVFLINWLVAPTIFRKQTNYRDGFFIGLISAGLVLGATLLISVLGKP